MIYETIWRGKWLADGAESIDEMIEALASEIVRLRDMKEAGVILEGSVEDDYATLTTSDENVGKRFGMEEA